MQDFGYGFDLIVVKGDHKLVASSCAAGDIGMIAFGKISCLPIDQHLSQGHELFEGMPFYALSDPVQAGLLEYFSQRGLDKDMAAEFISEFSGFKWQSEHSRSLKALKGFVR